MRAWFLCLLVLGLFVGCHHRPKFDKNKAGIDPVIPVVDQKKDVEIKVDSDLNEGTLSEDLSQLRPVFFDYDKSDIRSDQIGILQANAQILKQMINKVQIQGHCDERGTEEYNLALGDRRAQMVREYLSSLGIASEKLDTISYGESRPFENWHNEEAWRENRRAHFVEEH